MLVLTAIIAATALFDQDPQPLARPAAIAAISKAIQSCEAVDVRWTTIDEMVIYISKSTIHGSASDDAAGIIQNALPHAKPDAIKSLLSGLQQSKPKDLSADSFGALEIVAKPTTLLDYRTSIHSSNTILYEVGMPGITADNTQALVLLQVWDSWLRASIRYIVLLERDDSANHPWRLAGLTADSRDLRWFQESADKPSIAFEEGEQPPLIDINKENLRRLGGVREVRRTSSISIIEVGREGDDSSVSQSFLFAFLCRRLCFAHDREYYLLLQQEVFPGDRNVLRYAIGFVESDSVDLKSTFPNYITDKQPRSTMIPWVPTSRHYSERLLSEAAALRPR